MTDPNQSAIDVSVDLANPGHFFACAGIFELAHRLWGGAEGWFDVTGKRFHAAPIVPGIDANPFRLLKAIADCPVSNTLSADQLRRIEQLGAMGSKEIKANSALEDEKKKLDSLWREAPVLLGAPFELRLDWFADDYSGGSTFKTWAGQQSVVDIARGMQRSLLGTGWQEGQPREWLIRGDVLDASPFNFDAALASAGAARDVGFSLDPLKAVRVFIRPMVELCAFIGLQRCRPIRLGRENRFRYVAWPNRLAPEIAAAVACGAVPVEDSVTFEFSLLYRTKYLKSFLPAVSTTN